MQLRAAKATEDHMVDVIEECDSGHFVMLSKVEWTAGMLRRAAGEKHS